LFNKRLKYTSVEESTQNEMNAMHPLNGYR